MMFFSPKGALSAVLLYELGLLFHGAEPEDGG